MLASIFSGLYGTRIINSCISIVAIILCVVLAYLVFRHKFDSKRSQHQFRSRMAYLGILIFLMVMVRIWIEGFTHIFTMMSLVAAGLVVTNKESIMNIAGWLIINWRGVFSEGDNIQIQSMIGYITDIRLFHFKLYEMTSLTNGKATGKIIKVPNSLIISNSFTLFTGEKNLYLNQYSLMLKGEANLSNIVKHAQAAISKILKKQYQDEANFSNTALRKKNAELSSLIDLTPIVMLKPVPDKDDMFLLIVNFYCYPKHGCFLESELTQSLLNYMSKFKHDET